jgi:aminopeptidase YwaD
MNVRFDMAALEQRLRDHVATLSATPRPPGSGAHRLIQALIQTHLTQAGFTVQRDAYNTPTLPPGLNLLTTPLPNRPELPLVIIGAHYDSRLETPGADDNASGVAALLELAAWLGPQLAQAANWSARLQLVAYDQEEDGMVGSQHHCRQLTGPLRAMVSLEMLGYTDQRPGSQRLPPSLARLYPDVGNFIGVVGNQGSHTLVDTVAASLKHIEGLPVEKLVVPGDGSAIPDTRRSDHSPFWDRGLPAVMVTDTSFFRNPHYHQPTDTPDTLDYPFLTQVTAGVCLMVEQLLTTTAK